MYPLGGIDDEEIDAKDEGNDDVELTVSVIDFDFDSNKNYNHEWLPHSNPGANDKNIWR